MAGMKASLHEVLFPVNPAEDEKTLEEYSEKDKPWDIHRSSAADVEKIYADAAEFEKYAHRINQCSGILHFARPFNLDTGERSFKLKMARFCRVRHCPVCQWRRSLMYLARFLEAVPALVDAYPKSRWLFLTLTVRNCRVEDLGKTITAMNKAWDRLSKRKAFRIVQGWIRTTEVTRAKDGLAHPHFHVLLMVPPSYFKGKTYISRNGWANLWQSAGRLDYFPQVHIEVIKPRDPADPDPVNFLQGAAAEVLKYSVKPADMTVDPEWFRELTRQVHKRRFLASGGVLKDSIRQDDETEKDLLLDDKNPSLEYDDGSRLCFSYRPDRRKYYRDSNNDLGPEHEGETLTAQGGASSSPECPQGPEKPPPGRSASTVIPSSKANSGVSSKNRRKRR